MELHPSIAWISIQYIYIYIYCKISWTASFFISDANLVKNTMAMSLERPFQRNYIRNLNNIHMISVSYFFFPSWSKHISGPARNWLSFVQLGPLSNPTLICCISLVQAGYPARSLLFRERLGSSAPVHWTQATHKH